SLEFLPDLFMAELFSLMPESASCKTDRVEATRSLFGTSLPVSFQWNAPATSRIHQSNHQDRLPWCLCV
ncbi:MAG: hypothetical protein WBG26_06075, partial [Candidatus Binataceae bacterium]